MARNTDRKKISEAVRTHSLWRREAQGSVNYGAGGSWVAFVTDYAEHLYVEYTEGGMVRKAKYTHFDEDGTVVDLDVINTKRRERVMIYLTQRDVR